MTSHSKTKSPQLLNHYRQLVKVHGLEKVETLLKDIIKHCEDDKDRADAAKRYTEILNNLIP